ncbi:Uncharacterised protein [uncultured archaeon]|nr:Uncharacterised protein [uncultured archaeon]
MGNKQSAREALRARIQARAAAKEAAAKVKNAGKKFATLRRIAIEEPHEVDAAISELAAGFGELSTALQTMAQNLDLGGVPATASLKARIAAKNNYASRFRRIAEEAPEQFEAAYNEVYQALDGLSEDMENAAENLGISLALPTEGEMPGMESEPKEIAEGEHEVIEEAEKAGLPVPEEVSEHAEEEEKEASGSDWFVTDREADGQPKKPTVAAKKSVVTVRK